MITKTLKTGLFILAIASFSVTSAQIKKEVKKDKSEKMFSHIDADADGVITMQEFVDARLKDPSKESQLKKRFLHMDTDGNTTIDKAEFKVYFENKRKTEQIRAKKKKSAQLEKKQ